MSYCGVACGQSQFSSHVQGVDSVLAVKYPVMGGACRRNPQHFGVCTQVRGFSAQVIHRFVHRKPVSKSPAGLAVSSGSACWCWRDTRHAGTRGSGRVRARLAQGTGPVTDRPACLRQQLRAQPDDIFQDLRQLLARSRQLVDAAAGCARSFPLRLVRSLRSVSRAKVFALMGAKAGHDRRDCGSNGVSGPITPGLMAGP